MYRVWECKIVVPHDAPMPSGFDAVPRRAAIEAVEAFGVDVVCCFSGWGGSLDETEIAVIENKPPKQDQPTAPAGRGEESHTPPPSRGNGREE